MAGSLLEQIAVGEAPPFVPINVEQYHQMIRLGILPEGAPVELIDGLLVWKDRSARGGAPMPHDPRHALTLKSPPASGAAAGFVELPSPVAAPRHAFGYKRTGAGRGNRERTARALCRPSPDSE